MSLLADAYVQLKVQGQQAVYGALNTLSSMLAKLGQAASRFASTFRSAMGGMANGVRSALASIPSLVAGAITSFGQFTSRLGGIARSIANALKTYVPSALAGAGVGLAILGALFPGPAIGAALAALFAAAVAAVGQRIAPKVRAALQAVAAVIKQVLPAAFQAAMQKAGQIISAVAPKVSALASAIKTKLVGALNTAKNAAMAVGSAIAAISYNAIPFIGGFFNFIRGGIQSVIGLAGRLTSALFAPLRMLANFMFSWRGILASLGASFSTAAVGRYIAHWTADAESAKVTFEVLLGSAGQAVTLLNQLQELADKTPLQLPEVRDAAKHLLAMGVSATQVTDTIRRLGDVSQGLGLDLNHVADIYGKVSQANRLTGEDMRRFRLNGIPIARELAIMLGKSTNEIQHMAHTGQIGFKEVEMVFRKMTDQGGIFFELMKKKSQTLEGLFSTIKDSLRNLAVFFGQGLSPAVKSMERQIIKFLDGAKEKIWPLRNQFRIMAEELAARLPRALKFLTDTALPVFVEGLKAARAVMHALGQATRFVTQQILSWFGGLNGVQDGIANILREVRFLAENWRAVWDVATAFFDDFISNAKVTFTSLWDDFKENARVVFGRLPMLLGLALAAMSQVLTPFIDSLGERIAWAMNPFRKGNAPQLRFGSAGLFGSEFVNRLKRLFDDLPGFNAPKLKKALSPAVQDAIDRLKRAHIDFLHIEKMQAGLDKLRQLWERFTQTRPEALRDTTADLGDAMEEAAKKDKAKFEHHGLVEFHKAIQKGIKGNPEAVAQRQRQEQIDQQKTTNDFLSKAVDWIKNHPGNAAILANMVFAP